MTPQPQEESTPAPTVTRVAVFAQTLTVAGFIIEKFDRYVDHALCYCNRRDLVGCQIPYLIGLTELANFPPEATEETLRTASQQSRVPLLIAGAASHNTLSWEHFLEALGGAVPSWRALTREFNEEVRVLSANRLPRGFVGEPWFLFEDAVADGFEFALGRRVTRLGGRRRGQDVPDSICLTPDCVVAVIDAKASENPFSVNKTELRPLEDYVDSQVLRQQGHPSVGAALIVANTFKQNPAALLEEGMRFLAETGVPLCLAPIDVFLELIELVRSNPTARNAVAWRQVFCKPGLLVSERLSAELARVATQRRTLER